MKKNGICTDWFMYQELPYRVIEDCRLLQNYEAQRQKLTRQSGGV